jgi:hypothetical protein
MTTLEIKNRIEELNEMIFKLLLSENNNVENASKWYKLNEERIQLKNKIN